MFSGCSKLSEVFDYNAFGSTISACLWMKNFKFPFLLKLFRIVERKGRVIPSTKKLGGFSMWLICVCNCRRYLLIHLQAFLWIFASVAFQSLSGTTFEKLGLGRVLSIQWRHLVSFCSGTYVFERFRRNWVKLTIIWDSDGKLRCLTLLTIWLLEISQNWPCNFARFWEIIKMLGASQLFLSEDLMLFLDLWILVLV